MNACGDQAYCSEAEDSKLHYSSLVMPLITY